VGDEKRDQTPINLIQSISPMGGMLGKSLSPESWISNLAESKTSKQPFRAVRCFLDTPISQRPARVPVVLE
jgi:hypothetical protein